MSRGGPTSPHLRDLRPCRHRSGPTLLGRMRIGAKIMLNIGLDAARAGLASLADSTWMMTLPQQQAVHPSGHPAGSARPGRPGIGGGTGLVAVTFEPAAAALGSSGSLAVQWESVEPRDSLAVLLVGDIVLGPAPATSPGQSTLVLAGYSRLLPAAGGGDEQARVGFLKEVARSFITSVAVAVASSADPRHQPQPPGPASSWAYSQR